VRRLLALALAGAALGAGCSSGADDPDGTPTLTVYVSMPLRGPSGVDGRDAADGARLALADADGRAGEAEVRAVVLDASEGGSWSPARSAANARRATEDSTSLAYIGDFESGATRASLPVTNRARLLQVSPASSADDLVLDDDEVTFGRVIPSDAAQAAAAAAWVDRLDVRSVATVSDGTAFGDSLVRSFEAALRGAPLRRPAELVFYGGLANGQPRVAGQLMVSDAGIDPVVGGAPGTLATSAALDPSQLPPAGQRFAAAFETEYGRAPGRYAAYGYEAMAVILDAIARADNPADRDAVIDAFLATADRDSILGTYSITDTGETTLGRVTGYRLGVGGTLEPVAELD
jgi:branched-chain amino acid transport system substrate-binding protein